MRHHLRTLTLLAIVTTQTQLGFADTPPARKSGLWETVISMSAGMPNHTSKECVDQTTDAETIKMATDTSKAMGGSCSKNIFKRTADGFETESVCNVGGSTLSSKGIFTGDFTTSYAGEVTTISTPPLFGNGGSKTTITAKYVGECGADMKPGDVILGNGIKTNIKDAAAQAEKMAQTLKNVSKGSNEAPFGGDIGQAMMAAQGQMKAEDLRAIQDAMKDMEVEGLGH